jgi:hypothetical protein
MNGASLFVGAVAGAVLGLLGLFTYEWVKSR